VAALEKEAGSLAAPLAVGPGKQALKVACVVPQHEDKRTRRGEGGGRDDDEEEGGEQEEDDMGWWTDPAPALSCSSGRLLRWGGCRTCASGCRP
jgi:hypothetical protein